MLKKTLSKNSFKSVKSGNIAKRSEQFKVSIQKLLERYPLCFFVGMFVCLLVSGILAFTVMRVQEVTKLPQFPGLATAGIVKSTTDIMGSYSSLMELDELKHNIAVFIQKDSLSVSDSIHLSAALKRYEQLYRSLIPINDSSSTP